MPLRRRPTTLQALILGLCLSAAAAFLYCSGYAPAATARLDMCGGEAYVVGGLHTGAFKTATHSSKFGGTGECGGDV
jgi:hypothetical protein